MNTLQAESGKYLTQNKEGLPIEERIFVRKISGVKATKEHFPLATPEEVGAWEEWKKKEEEKSMAYEEDA